MNFKLHDVTSAPEASRPVMEATEKAFGFLPNLYAVFAESPAAIEAYAALNNALQKCALSPVEQQVVALTVSAENNCSYCVGAPSAIAGMVKCPQPFWSNLETSNRCQIPSLRHCGYIRSRW